MYFQIENTPEYIRRARRVENIPKESPKEECPRLILAPFSKPPQVVFDNVLIGSSCEKNLEVFNPSKQSQQITLGKALPPGLVIHLPEEWIEPETCYCLTMMWTPTQPTAVRETIRFTNENRGRYDIIVVLKSVMNIKGKNNQPKGYKISPAKMKKKVVTKKSPVGIYKKKSEIIYNTSTRVKKTVNEVQTAHNKVYQSFNKENVPKTNDYSVEDYTNKCPFDSPTSIDLNFNSSEVFSNMRKTNILQDTCDTYNVTNDTLDVAKNVLKPSNKRNCDVSATDIFDNITFTPLKSIPDKLGKRPQIIISGQSESELDDSIDMRTVNIENQTHSITSLTLLQPPNKWLTENYMQNENQLVETPTIQNRKHPNTSSPKELNSPNFSINTDVSRISDLSFFPQRFSTERKCIEKKNVNETHDMFDEKLSSDTYTKDSPNAPVEQYAYQVNTEKPPHYFNRDQVKMCRLSLFREYQHREAYDRNYLNAFQHNDFKMDVRSPPRSITPPLQSIPEESTQFSDTRVLDKTDKHIATFTIDRTFDKTHEKSLMTQTWSKKAIRVEPDLWKVPVAHVKKSLKAKAVAKSKDSNGSKISNTTTTTESNESFNQNITFNQIGNIYSQSSTVDPFLSSTYFYDEEAVYKFEKEFKRWLNCILTPPADLDSNVEQKIDVGKAWLENRNKEVPLAPTKEQVSSAYHNSHRLESLRRSARSILLSPEIAPIFQKLNAQIEKKLITIRSDRNLHLDVGLQKIIMELLLSYNPLWLRIGLEAIYGLVLPLKSNSDIEGLTGFIIQRMFKNPNLKNKHSKSSAPNMLLPAYMEAIKKFTLKKFFKLVFFLDQAKQRKLIPHDPCLFCRNAICKESREIIIRFTRELIAGIGDITKHLRPLGYVVSHKQSYLDEYKFAVHNLALDLRDGVRLTKVMEIIMMKNALLTQLRTPAISRLQKIHNVQVALNALKEANFVIFGDITAADIADGHREKTLSLLWQIIHVFRAPLFEKAANVIQTWWRKKYEVIAEKRRQVEKMRLKKSVTWIQERYRGKLLMRLEMQKFASLRRSVVILQSYYRMRKQRKTFSKLKNAVKILEERYIALIIMRNERNRYLELKKNVISMQALYRTKKCRIQYLKNRNSIIRLQRQVRAQKLMKKERYAFLQIKQAALVLQKYVRSYLLMKKTKNIYNAQRKSAIAIQRYFRSYLIAKPQRHAYIQLRNASTVIQKAYRSLFLMRRERNAYTELRNAAICIQRRYRAQVEMRKCNESYSKLKAATLSTQRRYRALIKMREQRSKYLRLKMACIKIQQAYRAYAVGKQQRQKYLKQKAAAMKIQNWLRSCKIRKDAQQQYQQCKQACVTVQRHYKAYIIGRKQRQEYIKIKTATITIQRFYRSYIEMKTVRKQYIQIKISTIKIQIFYRSHLETRKQRQAYLKMKTAVSCIENTYKRYKEYQIIRQRYLKLHEAAVNIQRRYRSILAMRSQRNVFIRLKQSIITIQQRYKALLMMRKERQSYLRLRSVVVTIQTRYRAQCLMKQERLKYITILKVCTSIQRYYRAHVKAVEQRQVYLKLKESTIVLQRRYRALLAMRKERFLYLAKKNATITIQRRLRAQNLMLQDRHEYMRKLKACKTIQSSYRAYLAGKRQMAEYLKIKTSIVIIQTRFRMFMEMRKVRNPYLQLKNTVIFVQRRFRANQWARFVRRNEAAKTLQTWFRSIRKRDICRKQFLQQREQIITVQSIIKMHLYRKRFLEMKRATLTIERYYVSYSLIRQERHKYVQVRTRIIKLQSCVRRYIARKRYLRLQAAVSTIKAAYKLKRYRESIRSRREAAAICLQKHVRRYLIQSWYRRYRQNVLFIQEIWRGKLLTRLIRCVYLQKRRIIIKIQSVARGYLLRRQIQFKKDQEHILKMKEEQRLNWAASKIQALFRGHRARAVSAYDTRYADLRRRWREGALQSTQESIKERNEEAMEVLKNMSDIETVIRAFRSIELITEVYPMAYKKNAASVVRRIYWYMVVTNRSISSIEVLSSAAAILVNMARYKSTGPKIYARERIPPILKFMLRFSSSQTALFCVLSTYLWLFSKYDEVREDLTEFLNMPEHHKILRAIKGNVDRMKRMAINARNKFHTPQPCKSIFHTKHYMNISVGSSTNDSSILLPSLEPDYGIIKIDKPRYFIDAEQAINCLFQTYNL